ncbi:MAG: hypothetical protein VX964_01315 [Verrucomicrobiota bacterium]|nr:hypothetical protein [Verrucomicrobiota bacterium]
MKWIESELVTPISFGIIENEKSYWANHFYSVIECINSHKNLQHSPMRFKSFPLWTLNEMRGFLPLNFFEVIQNYLYNWGFQYFLATFLNQKASKGIVEELISRLSQMYNVDFSSSLSEYSFYISGNDSTLSQTLQDNFTEVFPLELRSIKANTQKLINESDLCLILKNPITEGKVGIFGEVEGIHGNKLRNKSYWDNKQDFCVFSFGVIDGPNKECYVESLNVNGIDRVCFHLEKENFVVKDFHQTLEYMKYLFMNGPSIKLQSHSEEFDYFVNMVKNYWLRPAGELLGELSRYIDGDDIIGKTQKTLSIITDIQA